MRKGSIIDIGFLIIMLAIISVGLIFGKLLYNKIFFNEDMQNIMNRTAESQEIVNEVNNSFSVVNYGIVFLFVGLYITALILAYKMTTENYFLPFAFIIIVFFTLLAVVVSHAMTNLFLSNSELITVAEEMNMAFMIMNKLPWLTFLGGMFLLVVMYIGGE